MRYEDLEDKELLDRINKSAIATRLKDTEEFQLLQEGADRIIERAVKKFALGTKVGVDTISDIIELQVIIRKYKYGLFSEIEQLAQEGDIAFEEAKDRGFQRN